MKQYIWIDRKSTLPNLGKGKDYRVIKYGDTFTEKEVYKPNIKRFIEEGKVKEGADLDSLLEKNSAADALRSAYEKKYEDLQEKHDEETLKFQDDITALEEENKLLSDENEKLKSESLSEESIFNYLEQTYPKLKQVGTLKKAIEKNNSETAEDSSEEDETDPLAAM